MQLKLNRRCNIMIISFLALLLAAIIYLTLNPTVWYSARLEVIVLLVVISTVFLIFFKYYENNADKNIINKMVKDGYIALAKITDTTFERIIKDSNNRKYPIWCLKVEFYDKDLKKHEGVIYEKFNSSMTRLPNGFVYITYDPNKPDHMFVIPNILLAVYEDIETLISNYETNIKDIRYLNVYYKQGLIIERYKESLKKSKGKS